VAVVQHIKQRRRTGEAFGGVVKVGQPGQVAAGGAAVWGDLDQDELGGEPLGEVGGNG
jgi:hypothetical protein